MADPTVSFIVPCYRLAHLLGECVQSILSQTCADFEILIMDDCSPDNTPEVARSFGDHRIRHVRNEPNLGHLRNYNKGLELARGKFVWLISADDRLHCDYILQRYVDFVAAHPEAGYVFCPSFELRGGTVMGVLQGSVYRDHDAVLDGRSFLRELLDCNCIPAPAVMIRKKCLEEVGFFPLDMPFGGDWYLWCVLALRYPVGYLAEPMVDRRMHEMAMTNTMSQQNVRACVDDDLALPWRVRSEAERLGAGEIVELCRGRAAEQFGRFLAGADIRGATAQITVEDFQHRLAAFTGDAAERRKISAAAFLIAGDACFWRNNLGGARDMYSRALAVRPFWPAAWVKAALARAANPGRACRKAFASMRSPKLKAR